MVVHENFLYYSFFDVQKRALKYGWVKVRKLIILMFISISEYST